MATRRTASWRKSARLASARRLSAGTASTSRLRVKLCRCAATIRPRCCARSMVNSSAEANTSTGAPRSICCSSAPEAPTFSATRTSGFCAVKAAAISLKALVRLAAAETVSWIGCAWAWPITGSKASASSRGSRCSRFQRRNRGDQGLGMAVSLRANAGVRVIVIYSSL